MPALQVRLHRLRYLLCFSVVFVVSCTVHFFALNFRAPSRRLLPASLRCNVDMNGSSHYFSCQVPLCPVIARSVTRRRPMETPSKKMDCRRHVHLLGRLWHEEHHHAVLQEDEHLHKRMSDGKTFDKGPPLRATNGSRRWGLFLRLRKSHSQSSISRLSLRMHHAYIIYKTWIHYEIHTHTHNCCGLLESRSGASSTASLSRGT